MQINHAKKELHAACRHILVRLSDRYNLWIVVLRECRTIKACDRYIIRHPESFVKYCSYGTDCHNIGNRIDCGDFNILFKELFHGVICAVI